MESNWMPAPAAAMLLVIFLSTLGRVTLEIQSESRSFVF
jgi:hypothetical protein